MLIDAEYDCAYCGARNETSVDPSAGRRQSYVEDCQTCCRPNALEVEIGGDDGQEVYIEARREGGTD